LFGNYILQDDQVLFLIFPELKIQYHYCFDRRGKPKHPPRKRSAEMTKNGVERLAKLRRELEEAAGNGKPLTDVKVSAGWLLSDVADILEPHKETSASRSLELLWSSRPDSNKWPTRRGLPDIHT
jgi:hypothetical protein